ncbi:MAG: hypothetical protein EXS15_01130 [Phycisphaerales bacterium]|nr:hypothetical protein [Phycisphaerales bacterium]
MTEKKPAFNINRLNSLVKKYSARARTEEPNSSDLLALMLHSSLLYDATTDMADTALQRIRTRNVDFNEFRVNLVEEMVETIGTKYPDGFERMRRLRMTLFDLFRRHHRVGLEQLVGKPKRDVRTYLENLEGMPTFVVSRCMLLGFEVALVPIDWATIDLLTHYEVLTEPIKPSALTEIFAKKFKSDRSREMHFALSAAVDAFHKSGKADVARKTREAIKLPRGAAAASAASAAKAKPKAKTAARGH